MAARNPTHDGCSSDINALHSTDFRPSKALYVDVKDSNKFRSFLQHNGNNIRKAQLKKYEQSHKCCACEQQPEAVVPFNSGFSCGNVPNNLYPGLDQQLGDRNLSGYKK